MGRRSAEGATALCTVRNQLHLLQPHRRFSVAGGAVVPTRRERTARAHFGGVRHARALKLADLEETPGEYPQPVLDVANGVLVPTFLRDVGPAAHSAVAPGTVGQEGDLRRGVSQTGGVIHEEVV